MEWLVHFDLELFQRLGVNLAVLAVFLFFVYGRGKSEDVHRGAFFLFGSGVFLVTRLLHNVEMTMGFAFGLFAVFSMLRYRTESLTVRDMTYLFVVIAISLISSVSPLNYIELLLVHGFVCLLALALENRMKVQQEEVKTLTYEKIENIKPENYAALLQDLRERTGLDISRADVQEIDFLKDTAQVKIHYAKSDQPVHGPY